MESGHEYEDRILASEVAFDNALEDNFQAYATAEGSLPVEHLPTVLRVGDLAFTEEAVHEALLTVGGRWGTGDPAERTSLMLHEVLDIFHYLVPQERPSGEIALDVEKRQDSRKSAILSALRSCFEFVQRRIESRSENEQFASGMKPTTRLIVIVALLTFLIALVVGGTAVALDWTSAVKAQYTALEEELKLMLNAADSFTVTQARKREQEYQMSTASMLTHVIKEVGYETNLATTTNTMLGAARVSGMIVDHLHLVTKTDEMRNLAQNTAKMLDLFCTTLGKTAPNFDLTALIQTINQKQLPNGHEILVFANRTLELMHPLKFYNECTAQQPCANATNLTASVTTLALQGQTGSFIGNHYTASGEQVYGGYSPMPCFDAALIYEARLSFIRPISLNQTVKAVDMTNIQYQGSTEILIQQNVRPGFPLTQRKLASDCPKTGCAIDQAGAWAIAFMLNGSTPTAIGKDYRDTVPIISTVAALESMDGNILFEIDLSEVVQNLLGPLAHASSVMNSELDGSVELLMGHKAIINGSVSYEYLTQRRFMDGCPATGCVKEKSMIAAAVNCQSGVGSDLDYRGMPVLTAYTCVSELDVGICLEVDEADVQQKSINQLVDYANSQNADSSGSLELMVGQLDPLTQTPKILSSSREADHPMKNSFEPMNAALKKTSGSMKSTDYREKAVLTRYAYSSELNIGFVLKIDTNEVEKPLILQLIIILFTAVGIALLGVLVVGFAAQHMLASIVDTWERSKQAVQEQKESFEQLVSAIYPKFASDRLLSGETQIVLELKEATMFFSDIVGFSTISNRLTADELMGWIGYTFGVMDHIADFYQIHKIKTIGDAYFAISGLPGLIPEGMVDDHTMRMVKFASAIVQIFSGRYLHPDSGSCLQMIASHSAVMRKEKKDALKKGQKRGSQVSASTMKTTQSSVTAGPGSSGMCAMRYGIATGSVTVGVLPGKCPAFDVWGKTVNLASRMESCSRPSAILVSEAVYRTVMADPTNPFSFYDQVNVFAKGFGNVPAFYVYGSREIPPKALLAVLSVEPAMGEYFIQLDGLTVKGVKNKEPTKGAAPGAPIPGMTVNNDLHSARSVMSHRQSPRSAVPPSKPVTGIPPPAGLLGAPSYVRGGDASSRSSIHSGIIDVPNTIADPTGAMTPTSPPAPASGAWQ